MESPGCSLAEMTQRLAQLGGGLGTAACCVILGDRRLSAQ